MKYCQFENYRDPYSCGGEIKDFYIYGGKRKLCKQHYEGILNDALVNTKYRNQLFRSVIKI